MPAAARRQVRLILAFDPGRQKTGVAIGNLITGGARPLATISGSLADQADQAAGLCAKWQPQLLLIGKSITGAKKPDSCSRKFAGRLHELSGIKCEFVDEYLTSQLARDRQEKNHSDDAIAATILAEDWLQRVTLDPRTGSADCS